MTQTNPDAEGSAVIGGVDIRYWVRRYYKEVRIGVWLYLAFILLRLCIYSVYWEHRDKAFQYYYAGHYAQAVPGLRLCVQDLPKAMGAKVMLADCLYHTGHMTESTELYRQAIRGGSDYADNYYALGQCYQANGRHHDAVDAWRKAIQRASEELVQAEPEQAAQLKSLIADAKQAQSRKSETPVL